jgi:hypothetical protein
LIGGFCFLGFLVFFTFYVGLKISMHKNLLFIGLFSASFWSKFLELDFEESFLGLQICHRFEHNLHFSALNFLRILQII